MTWLPAALRRTASVALAVAFVALATSGLAMLLVDRFGFQVRMHPVHNVFGVVMVAAGAVHVAYNWKLLVAHLRLRWPMILGALLAAAMALLLLEGLTRPLDAEAIRSIDEVLTAARRAERAG